MLDWPKMLPDWLPTKMTNGLWMNMYSFMLVFSAIKLSSCSSPFVWRWKSKNCRFCTHNLRLQLDKHFLEAAKEAEDAKNIWILGGTDVYRESFKVADEFWATHVHAVPWTENSWAIPKTQGYFWSYFNSFHKTCRMWESANTFATLVPSCSYSFIILRSEGFGYTCDSQIGPTYTHLRRCKIGTTQHTHQIIAWTLRLDRPSWVDRSGCGRWCLFSAWLARALSSGGPFFSIDLLVVWYRSMIQRSLSYGFWHHP